MSKALTLEAVKSEFDEWRATKKPGEQIPQRLWNLAKPLTKRYTRSQIAYQLRLAASQYKKHLYSDNTKAKQKQPAPKPNEFLTLMPANHNENHQEAGLKVEIKQPDGKVIVLHAQHQDAISTILNHIMN